MSHAGPDAVRYWKPTDLMGFANLFDALLGVEKVHKWPGSK